MDRFVAGEPVKVVGFSGKETVFEAYGPMVEKECSILVGPRGERRREMVTLDKVSRASTK